MSFAHILRATLLLGIATPALAADPPALSPRVDKLEKEMKAVQRKVFPGGSPAFFEPEISAPASNTAAGTPATQPLNELTSRVDGLERELARITSQMEQDEHRLGLLSEQSAKDRANFDVRLKTLEAVSAPPPVITAPAPIDEPVLRPPSKKPGTTKTPKPAPVEAEPVAEKPAPVAAAAAPATGDPAEDAYMEGYKLWEAKKFPEAQAALAKVAKQYPKSRRASYARNLLGRAQLDGGTPATAAQTFYANYQSDPRGERAPDSLFYLGQALTQLKKSADACRAYGELEQVYGATMAESLKAKLPAAKKAAACK